MKITYKDWNIEAMTGYHPITTFYMDFSIADRFGIGALKDTFKRAFETAKMDYKYLTEFVMVMNWKIWEHYDDGNMKYAELYNKYWETTAQYATENLKGEELSYYFRVTD